MIETRSHNYEPLVSQREEIQINYHYSDAVSYFCNIHELRVQLGDGIFH